MRVFAVAGVIVLVLGASSGSFVAGLFIGASYTLAREAQTDALVTASALARLRDGRSDEGVSMLETTLESDFLSHFGGFTIEHAAPEIWVFGPLNLGGMAFAANYLNDHPRPERGDFLQSIIDCHLRPDLPAPKDELEAHRQAIANCYADIRDTLQ